MKYLFLLGRIFFSALFIEKSLCHFTATAVQQATNVGAPVPFLLVPLFGLLALLGGLSILLGYKPRIGAWMLILFLLPVTFIMHRFWELDEGQTTAILHNLCFMKNLALMGACLMIAYMGTGPLSLSKK